MYGLAAIQQANGWAMAGAGAAIVLCGLTVLSFLISMIPKITAHFEEKPQPAIETEPTAIESKTLVPDRFPEDIQAAATVYMALTEDLGKAFSLIDLHRQSKKLGLPHPHLSISRFRDAGILVSTGEGRFSWQPKSE